jgi:hypothetical protein
MDSQIRNKQYKCEVCEVMCASKTSIKRHIRYKHDPRAMKWCPFPGCAYKTGRPDVLDRHYLIHRKHDPQGILLNQIQTPQALLTLDTPLITVNYEVPILPPDMQTKYVSQQESELQLSTPEATIPGASEIVLADNIPIDTEVMVEGPSMDDYIRQAIDNSVQQCTGISNNPCDTSTPPPLLEGSVTLDPEEAEGEEASPPPLLEATVEPNKNPQDSPSDPPGNPSVPPENNLVQTSTTVNNIPMDNTTKNMNMDSDTTTILNSAQEYPEENGSLSSSDNEETGEQLPPNAEPADNNTKIIKETLVCTQKGYKVCVYDFNQLPTPGRMYKVDKENNMVAFKWPPGQVYQVDKDGFLISIGIFQYQDI